MHKTKIQRRAAIAVDFIVKNKVVTLTELTLKLSSCAKEERKALTDLVLQHATVERAYVSDRGRATTAISLTKKAAVAIVAAAGGI